MSETVTITAPDDALIGEEEPELLEELLVEEISIDGMCGVY
ncbi:MAG: mycofactocin precursor MftA [Actinomycetota bacterium]|nr:mycofactocin precursor MftA [Actinomycetota bacterium]